MRRIIARRAWTSSERGGVELDTPVNRLFLHHTAGPMPIGGRQASKRVEKKLIRATRKFHISGRGMSDIAYNYGTMPSGRIYDLRGLRTGGHTFGFNLNSLAIVSFGNYDVVKPSDELIRGYTIIGRKLRRRKKITKDCAVMGHTEVGAQGGGTACPGKFIMARKDEIKRGIRK